jgi:hypothetical protein
MGGASLGLAFCAIHPRVYEFIPWLCFYYPLGIAVGIGALCMCATIVQLIITTKKSGGGKGKFENINIYLYFQCFYSSIEFNLIFFIFYFFLKVPLHFNDIFDRFYLLSYF